MQPTSRRLSLAVAACGRLWSLDRTLCRHSDPIRTLIGAAMPWRSDSSQPVCNKRRQHVGHSQGVGGGATTCCARYRSGLFGKPSFQFG